MPKTSRATAKRVCDQISNDLSRAQDNVLVLGQLFQGYADKYLKPLGILVEALEENKRFIHKFKDEF
jgi:hypothetical protein